MSDGILSGSQNIDWDRIRIRPPICYFPPAVELIINRELSSEMVRKYGDALVSGDPEPNPWSVGAHLRARINITKDMIANKKLDPKIGEKVIAHFEGHLKELGIPETKL